MPTILADSFTTSLARLASDERKQAQLTAFTLMTEPDRPGLQFHRIDTSRDPNFRSVRVSRDICIIVHKTGGSLMLAYVDHHDDAYAWAEPRRIEAHPKTGAIQIVEARERVEEIARPAVPVQAAMTFEAPAPLPSIFAGLDTGQLLSVGVPEDRLADVGKAIEETFFALAAPCRRLRAGRGDRDRAAAPLRRGDAGPRQALRFGRGAGIRTARRTPVAVAGSIAGQPPRRHTASVRPASSAA